MTSSIFQFPFDILHIVAQSVTDVCITMADINVWLELITYSVYTVLAKSLNTLSIPLNEKVSPLLTGTVYTSMFKVI